jgi:heme/copper-type cytochrome/quinol oxidase subunit 2
VAPGTSYCNLCGAKLSGAKDEGISKPTELFPDSLVWAVVAVFTVGLGITIGLMAVMKDLLNFSQGLIVAFTLLSFLFTFAVEGVLIRLLLHRMRQAKEAGDPKKVAEQTTIELDATQQRALLEPVPSVIEHTTRILEPVYNEWKSK